VKGLSGLCVGGVTASVVVVEEVLVVVVPLTGIVLEGVPLSEPALVDRNTNAAASTTGTTMTTRDAALLTARWYETSSGRGGMTLRVKELRGGSDGEEQVATFNSGPRLHGDLGDVARDRRCDGRFHLHCFDRRDGLSRQNVVAGRDVHRD
jgi:hypothetical protein